MASNKKNKSKGSLTLSGMLQDLFGGRFLSVEFFKKNFILVIFVVSMMLMYISNKFTCQMYQEEVLNLEKELTAVQADWVNASSKYNSMKRESQMKTHVDTMRIDISAPEQPPYKLQTKQ